MEITNIDCKKKHKINIKNYLMKKKLQKEKSMTKIVGTILRFDDIGFERRKFHCSNRKKCRY